MRRAYRKPKRNCKTRKLRFRSEYEANKVVNHASRLGQEYVPIRSYKCEFCGGWHLTSREDLNEPSPIHGQSGITARCSSK